MLGSEELIPALPVVQEQGRFEGLDFLLFKLHGGGFQLKPEGDTAICRTS